MHKFSLKKTGVPSEHLRTYIGYVAEQLSNNAQNNQAYIQGYIGYVAEYVSQ